MKQVTKQWIKNFLKALKEIEEKHRKEKDSLWIDDNESVGMLMEAINILNQVIKED